MGEKLNKRLWTEISKLKLLGVRDDAVVKFIVESTPFDENQESAAKAGDPVIIGRILPNSEIYNQGAFRIEIKLTANYPLDPPEVRFLTPIYHPNVSKEGQFCHEILKKADSYKATLSLVDLIKAVVDHIDHPNIDYSLSHNLGSEYMNKRAEFNKTALEWVKKHALPRTAS